MGTRTASTSDLPVTSEPISMRNHALWEQESGSLTLTVGEGQKLLTNTTNVFSFWLRNPASSRGPVPVNLSATVACEPQPPLPCPSLPY